MKLDLNRLAIATGGVLVLAANESDTSLKMKAAKQALTDVRLAKVDAKVKLYAKQFISNVLLDNLSETEADDIKKESKLSEAAKSSYLKKWTKQFVDDALSQGASKLRFKQSAGKRR